MMQRCLSIAALVVLCLAGAALADHTVSSGYVIVTSPTTLVIDTPDGQQTYVVDDATIRPADLANGDFVVVRTEPGVTTVQQVIIVDERVEVLAELDREERAVVGTVSSTGTDQLLVETPDGGQAFVIDPEKLFPPMPEPDQRVIVTYRTLELHPPMHMATGLVLLPADFRLNVGQVIETSEPMQVAQVVPPPPPPPPAPKPAPAPEPVVKVIQPPAPVVAPIESLPQTATPLPLTLLAGVLLVGLGVATRYSR